MPYTNETITISLCRECAKYYKGKNKWVKIKISEQSKGCLAHYIDLNTVRCLKKRKVKAKKTHKATQIRETDMGDSVAAHLCKPYGCQQYVISNKTARELNRITTHNKKVTCGNCLRIMKARAKGGI